MPSLAATSFSAAVARIGLLRDTATDPRLRPLSLDKARIFLHASLAGYVASWESYLERLTQEFYTATADPLTPTYHAMHTLIQDRATEALALFNTPHADNARNLLLRYTGFDPYPVWIWPARHLNAVQVRERLAEILKVRHSFAHGFSMPAYPWNTNAAGQARLTWGAVAMTEQFFSNLVRRTDAGMQAHVRATYTRNLF